uniref:Fibulin-1 n=1 Tax=Myripristis murdjan TaxID=586833 RepID=A0A667YX29_9TELE
MNVSETGATLQAAQIDCTRELVTSSFRKILGIAQSLSKHGRMIAQEQCCAAVAGEKLCTTGINMAKHQGACERPFFQGDPWETQVSKMCCDCCVLGLMAAGRGFSCELEGLLLGRQCEHAAKTCCAKNTTDGTQPSNQKALSSDVNECLTGSHSCTLGQVCINTDGSFRCQRETSCGTGYELTDNNICQDIDECALEVHNCGPDFVCNNTAGSFRCAFIQIPTFLYWLVGCHAQDVFVLLDINECVAHTSPCQPGHTCINTVGSYTCRRNTITCGRGYHLNEDGTRCEDVDECRTGNVCGNHGCVNLVGSFRCECRVGFIFNSITKMCEDINECRHYPGRLCAHKCENTEGSYQCSCTTGFRLVNDGRNCEDVNECEANPCSQECANVYGSYQCYCRRGYQLSDIDGITCEDIDECALPAGGHVCSYRCSNSPGSFFCTCPPTGYTLSSNGRTCQDIDECATGSHTCSVSQSCFNVQGGFRCLSLECPPNFRRASEGPRSDSTVSVRCIKSCQPNDISCAVDPIHLITHTSLSLPTFREFTMPEEIVFLRTMAPANPAPLPGAPDVFFDIGAADDQSSFDVVKRSHNGMIMGVVRQVKPITGPRDLVVEVAMNYIRSGVVSHRNIVVIHLFISEFWF